MKKTLLAIMIGLSSVSAFATTQDCNCDKVTKAVFQADQQRQDKRMDTLQTSVNDTYAYANTKYTEAAGKNLERQVTDLQENKVSNSVFRVDQGRQDAALSATVSQQSERDSGQDQHINAVQDAAQSGNIKADKLAVRADQTDTKLAVTDDRSIHNAVRLDGVETVNTQQGERLDQHQSDISALYGETSVQSQRLDISNRNIAANRSALESTNKVVSAHSVQLANHEQRIGQLEQATTSKFANIDKRFDETDRHIDAGLSGVSAMANIPQVTEYQTFAVGAGVGARGGESAVAVGFSARASQAVVLKASVAGDSQQKWTVGGGISYGW